MARPASLACLAYAASLLLPCALSASCWVNWPRAKFPQCAQIAPAVALHWSTTAGAITWALDVDGEWTWVGLGTSEGGMLGADLAVAAAEGNGWVARDYWSEGFAFPTLDAQQDVSLVSVTRTHGNTLVALRRPLDTCDPQDRAITNDTAVTVVYAYGTGAFGYHGTTNRGQADVTFVADSVVPPPPPDLSGMQTLDMLMPAFAVPADNATTYACVNVEMPADRKYHIYRYQPLINSSLVHHFVVYACPASRTGPPPTAIGQPYVCFTNGHAECEEFYWGWAPGVPAIDAPPDAALAFGAGSTRYLTLNIHYNNVDRAQGVVDSSGFRLYYSPQLKPYDMGTLTLGSMEIAVPPGAAAWSTAPNVCPGACTAQLAAGAGGAVTLVDSFYHMHMLGRAMVTQHVRGGVELPPLGRRSYFQFDYQAGVAIPPATRTLLPGDALVTTCTFTGAGRANVTGFGLGSYDEMCYNFVSYYPYNPNITFCAAVAAFGVAACATEDELDAIAAGGTFGEALAAGKLLPLPANLTFKSYAPTCVRTAASALPADDDDDGGGGGGGGAHHARNVGGAVAAILIVTAVGGLAIYAVLRVMRRRKQNEEEQQLFEKYNPSNVGLSPLVAAPGAKTAGGLAGPGGGGSSSADV